MPARFWMICRAPTHPGSVTAPTKRYPSEEEARKAAQDLADQTGDRFLILSPTAEISPRAGQARLF